MKALLACLGYLLLGAAFCRASETDSSKAAFSQSDLLSAFSSPIQLGRDETDLYNPEDLSALLFLKPSIDIFSLGPFGQKRGFSNWGRIGKGEEILYDGQTRAPIYLNYPQSSEADLTSLQFEQADSVYFFDHPLASFLFGAQAPASIYLHSSSSDVQQPLVSARMNKRNSSGSPFSSTLQSTAIFDFRRPLGKKAFVRGIGSFRSSDTVIANDHSENQNYHLSIENPPDSKNHWKGAYELDRELGGIEPFTGIPDPNLSKNFRRDVFFFNMDGRLSKNTKIEADLRYQRTDQKILSDSAFLHRQVEERRPFLGLALMRESQRSLVKLFSHINGTTLNQHTGKLVDEWQGRWGVLGASKLNNRTIISAVAQVSETWMASPQMEGWVGINRSLGGHQTVFVTASSQVIYPSLFDRFFEPKQLSGYAERSDSGLPERSNRLNFTYKIETRRFTGGVSLLAERSDNYLIWEKITGLWKPTFRDIKGTGIEGGFELKFLGSWRGGYAYRSLTNRADNSSLPLFAKQRTYLRWTTLEVRPIKALSFRLVPMINIFWGYVPDIPPSFYSSRERAGFINLKAIGTVKNFNFFYSVENLFDRQYFLRGDLPQAGRSYFFGFNWNLWD